MRAFAPMVAALALAGCASTSDPNVQGADVATASWTSLQAASDLLDQAAKSGALHGTNAKRAHDDLQAATAALAAADNARTAGDLTSVQTDVATASALLAEILLIANNPSVSLPVK